MDAEENMALRMLEKRPFRLTPGQSRPLGLHLSPNGVLPTSVDVELTSISVGKPQDIFSVRFSLNFARSDLQSPHKFTFLHLSGIVSYAVIRPPSKKVCRAVDPEADLPVLLSLHGAGVEAGSREVARSLDSIPDLHSWVLFPTGVTPWCGDDWRDYIRFEGSAQYC